MKVTINGPGVTPSSIQAALEDLEKEYSLKIRDLTMYIRFVDKNGRVVDPKLPANGNELVITLSEEKGREIQDIPLSIEQMCELLELHFKRPLLESEIEKIISWVNDFHVTYCDLNEALIRQPDLRKCSFSFLDRWFYSKAKWRKEKEIMSR